MKKLAIITTHPIQYNAPWFKLLTERKKVQPKIFYTWGQLQQQEKYDPGFGKKIEWDIPLLEGYEYTFVKNVSSNPGTHHFNGIDNPSLNNEIRNWLPDAILVFGWSFKSHLKCLRYFHKKIPVIFRGDSTLLDEHGKFNIILRAFFLKWVYKHIDQALYVGTNNKKYFLKYGIKENQLVYAPHAIDNNRFAEPDDNYNQQAAVLKKNAGIEEEDLVIFFAGKFETKKNPFFLLQLAKYISSKKLKILFIGNGALEKNLKEAASQDKRILFMNFQNQLLMPVIYRMGDIFILPSLGPGETWGLGANEAMASGCGIILSEQVGGAVDLVRNNSNGIVLEKEGLSQCVQFINELIKDKEALNKMKAASRELIKNFSFDHIVRSVEDIFTILPAHKFLNQII